MSGPNGHPNAQPRGHHGIWNRSIGKASRLSDADAVRKVPA